MRSDAAAERPSSNQESIAGARPRRFAGVSVSRGSAIDLWTEPMRGSGGVRSVGLWGSWPSLARVAASPTVRAHGLGDVCTGRERSRRADAGAPGAVGVVARGRRVDIAVAAAKRAPIGVEHQVGHAASGGARAFGSAPRTSVCPWHAGQTRTSMHDQLEEQLAPVDRAGLDAFARRCRRPQPLTREFESRGRVAAA